MTIPVMTPSVAVPAARAAGTLGNAAENAAIREARDLPDLIKRLEVASPALAAQFVGKSLAASRTPWGTLLLPVVAYVATRYGLGWTPDVDALVAGITVLIGSYAIRTATRVPITGLFRPAPVVAETVPPVTKPGVVGGGGA